MQFQRDAEGKVSGLAWHRTAQGIATDLKATRLPLREEIVTFQSGDLTLRGKLVMPELDTPSFWVFGGQDSSAPT